MTREMTLEYDVAVIGAGPAGMMAAIFAARSGAKVLLLEKNEMLGRKILATGNGRCNITNKNIEINRYHGLDTGFAKVAFDSFGQTETMDFFESLGVVLKEEDRGRVFPRTNQATTVVEALTHELKTQNVDIELGFVVKKIERTSNWEVVGEGGTTFRARSLILTPGGKAAHQFGSSGDGLFWAANMGHTIVPIHASLVPIETVEKWTSELMGIKINADVTLLANNRIIAKRSGDLIFTHFGVSGPAIMGLAREVDPILVTKQSPQISIDLLPDIPSDRLDTILEAQISADNRKLIQSILAGLVPKNLAPRVLAMAHVTGTKKAAEISKADRRATASTLKDFRLTVSKVRPLKEAQVTAGGIATAEVGADMKSKIVENLYFAGEILDIDGDSGGFNLQWAWTSGKIAGENAGRKI